MIKIEKLNFKFKKPLFADLSIRFEQGKIIGLLGKNGAGKTTLLKLIAGTLKQQSGEIKSNGFEPGMRDPNYLKSVFLIPEEPYFPSLKIKNYVNSYGVFYENFNDEMFKDILNDFELDENLELGKVSHGQRKKFLIAFALATNCKVLLFDEPTNGLDIPSKSKFRQIIASYFTNEQTMIISTHQAKDIENTIDSVVVVDEGKCIFNQTMVDICEKLIFETDKSSEGEDIIYSEGMTGNWDIIKYNKMSNNSKVNLEVLFKGIIGKSNQINNIFNN